MAVLVVPTDEELEMAWQGRELLNLWPRWRPGDLFTPMPLDGIWGLHSWDGLSAAIPILQGGTGAGSLDSSQPDTGPRSVLTSNQLEIFDTEAAKLQDVNCLAQGTIYSDFIESAASKTGKAHVRYTASSVCHVAT